MNAPARTYRVSVACAPDRRWSEPTDSVHVALRFNGSVYRGFVTGLRKRGEDVIARVAFATKTGTRARVTERVLTCNIGNIEVPADYFGGRYREGHGPTLGQHETRAIRPFILADVDGVLDIINRE